MRSAASSTPKTSSAKRASSMGRPSTAMRSHQDTRWGLVIITVLRPAARAIDSTSAHTDPLPLVPATSTPARPR